MSNSNFKLWYYDIACSNDEKYIITHYSTLPTNMKIPDICIYTPSRCLFPIYLSHRPISRLLSAYVCLETIQTERQDLSAKAILLAGSFDDVMDKLELDNVV